MKRHGFTLLEMLIALAVVVAISTFVIGVASIFDVRDTSADAANMIVGALDNARQRAASEGQRQGVRLVLGKAGDHYVTSLMQVGGPDTFNQSEQEKFITDSSGRKIPNPDARPIRTRTPLNANYTILSNMPPIWAVMENSGALPTTGATISIGGNYYHMNKASGQWRTTRAVFGPWHNHNAVEYAIHGLRPVVLDNSHVTLLPDGSVIDVQHSMAPIDWQLPNRNFSHQMDILFGPDGRRVGTITQGGRMVILLVTNLADIGKQAGDLSKLHQEKAVSILGHGVISAHNIDETDTNGNGIADDPFNYAHLGIETR